MRSALIVGATGLVGRHCLSQLLADPDYSQVHVISRRVVAHEDAKLNVVISDFSDLQQVSSTQPTIFNVDDVFCCLGTTLKAAGSREAFEQVDYGYVRALAAQAAKHQARQFLLISAVGASPRALAFYSRVKGRTESAVSQMNFSALHIFRPSLLIGDRDEHRPGEALAQNTMPFIDPLLLGPLSRYRSVSGEQVARAMLRQAKLDLTGQHIHYPSDPV